MAETVTINVRANTTQAQTNLRELGEKISNLGMRITAAFTLPIVGAFAMAVRQSKELQAALKPIQDAFSGVAAQLGDALVPLIQELTPSIIQLANALASVVQWFAQLDMGTQKTIVGFLAAVAAIGPFITIIGQVIGTVGTVQTIMASLGTMLPALTTGITTFGTAAAAAITPLLPLLAAVAALIALVNSEFGKSGITAGKQLLTGAAAGFAGLIGGQDAARQTLESVGGALGVVGQPATPTSSGGQTIIYNNYGVDANNPYVKQALTPYINQNARSRGQR